MRCSCLFSTLPDEILLFDVLCYFDARQLCRLQSVCRRWKFLSSDPVLWKALDLSSHAARIDDASASSLLRRYAPSLQTLRLCNCSHLTPRLLSDPSPSPFSSLRQLRELHLCNVRALQDAAVIAVAAAAPHLEHVSLYGCIQITDVGVHALIDGCRGLQELSLRGVVKVTDAALGAMPATLRGLNIAGCKAVTSAGVMAVARRCAALERLNAHGVNASDAAVAEVARGCARLEALHLSSANPFGGNQLTDEGVGELRRLEGLTCLNLQGSGLVTDAGVAAVLGGVGRLERLNVGGCYRVTDGGVAALVAGVGVKALTHLSMFQCFNVTDVGVMGVVERAEALVHLDLHSCVAVTGRVLEMVGTRRKRGGGAARRRMSHKGLGEEGEEEGEGVGQRSVEVVEEEGEFYLPRLKTLDVGSCRKVTAEDVAALRAARPQLHIVHY